MLLQSELEEIVKGKTVIVVAHRLSTISNADKILVVKDGRIQEMGTHEELIKKKGLYYQLYTEQYQPS
jgi:ATP-binding cassette subfamily B protein